MARECEARRYRCGGCGKVDGDKVGHECQEMVQGEVRIGI